VLGEDLRFPATARAVGLVDSSEHGRYYLLVDNRFALHSGQAKRRTIPVRYWLAEANAAGPTIFRVFVALGRCSRGAEIGSAQISCT
jgi:hypothetical protein